MVHLFMNIQYPNFFIKGTLLLTGNYLIVWQSGVKVCRVRDSNTGPSDSRPDATTTRPGQPRY